MWRSRPDRNLSDLERRVGNAIRFGTIEAVDYRRARARVRMGPNVTAWLPWTTGRAGPDRSWHPPEIGEQVVLAAPAGDLNQAVILGSVYQSKHPAPGDRGTISRVVFEDGATVEYDRESHAYLLDVPEGGRITLRCGRSSLVITDEGISLDGPRIDLNRE